MGYIVEFFVELALPVIAAGVTSILVQLVAQKFSIFPKSAGNGLFLVLLPTGCSLFGAQLSPMVSAIWTVIGLSQIIWSLRRSKFQSASTALEIPSVSSLGDIEISDTQLRDQTER